MARAATIAGRPDRLPGRGDDARRRLRPGFASMVHGELGVPACEIASLAGVCASGVAALKSAFLQVRADGKRNAIHRALHGRWMFQHVHREHHRAIRPTPFSTYAMHPVEAALLGSVMVLVQPFHAFSLPTLILFPMVSLAMNNLGHMNYDLAPGRGAWHPLSASRRHERHHRHLTGNFGFLLPALDRWLGTALADGSDFPEGGPERVSKPPPSPATR